MQCVCVCVLEVDLCAFSINLSILWITTLCKQTRYKIVVIWGRGGGIWVGFGILGVGTHRHSLLLERRSLLRCWEKLIPKTIQTLASCNTYKVVHTRSSTVDKESTRQKMAKRQVCLSDISRSFLPHLLSKVRNTKCTAPNNSTASTYNSKNLMTISTKTKKQQIQTTTTTATIYIQKNSDFQR